MTQEKEFFASIEQAVHVLEKTVEDNKNVRIVTHSDADGIAAGSILSQTVRRSRVSFKTSCEKRVDEALLKELIKEDPALIIFTDLGSGYIDLMAKYFENSKIIVLDHHLPKDVQASNIVHVNPLLQGLDGARGISGAGVAYFLSKKVDEKNVDLSPLAIVGALADQQDKGEKKRLLGLNAQIASEAEEAGLIETKVDLIFYGYETRPIAKALAYTTSPFIPGLSGREDNCFAFLKETGIKHKIDGRWRALRDLSEEEKRTLFSSLSKHLVHEGISAETVHDLIGTIYTLTSEKAGTPLRDGREYASLLNACARMERPSLGLALGLGDRHSVINELEVISEEYRKKIAASLELVREASYIREMSDIYTIHSDGIDERIIGVVASILLSTGILKKSKPIIACAKAEEGTIKVSARSTEAIALEGIDLGEVMMMAAEKFYGRGGGHNIAAGAFLSEEYEKEFIEKVNGFVKGRRKSEG